MPLRPFYFLRHGQTDWNVEGRLQGRTDIHLNETGHAQARAAAAYFKAHPLTKIVSSPLQRALVTATYVADHLAVPLETDPRLQERHYGAIEGMTRAEIEAQPPETVYDLAQSLDWAGYQPLLPGPGGVLAESMDEIADRAAAATLAILEAHPGDTLLLVAHGTWFRGLVYRLTGAVVRTDNAVPYRLSPPAAASGKHWTIERLG